MFTIDLLLVPVCLYVIIQYLNSIHFCFLFWINFLHRLSQLPRLPWQSCIFLVYFSSPLISQQPIKKIWWILIIALNKNLIFFYFVLLFFLKIVTLTPISPQINLMKNWLYRLYRKKTDHKLLGKLIQVQKLHWIALLSFLVVYFLT